MPPLLLATLVSTAAEVLFFISAGAIAWVYVLYPALLGVAAAILGRRAVPESLPENREQWPTVSVVIAAFNEERVIRQRVKNLLALDYPASKLQVVVGSDGSTDQTAAFVRAFDDPRVEVIEYFPNRGREATHSDIIPRARGEIVVVTDADTSFDPAFVRHCAGALNADPRLGAVVGNLTYRIAGTAVSQFEGLYWRYDMAMKRWESDLGLLHNGSGPCQAFRRELFRRLKPRDDVDATTIVDILLQGFYARFLSTAVAYDVPPATTKAELTARIRQTSRSFVSGVRKWHPGLWFRYPLLTVSYLSHRILRWLSPYFFLLMLVSNLALLGRGGYFVAMFALQVAAYAVAIAGLAFERVSKRPIPVVSSLSSFAIANLGMLIGVFKGVLGRAPLGYQMPADPTFEE